MINVAISLSVLLAAVEARTPFCEITKNKKRASKIAIELVHTYQLTWRYCSRHFVGDGKRGVKQVFKVTAMQAVGTEFQLKRSGVGKVRGHEIG